MSRLSHKQKVVNLQINLPGKILLIINKKWNFAMHPDFRLIIISN